MNVDVGYSGKFIREPTESEVNMENWLTENAERMQLWVPGDQGSYSAEVTQGAQDWLKAVKETL